MESRRTPHIYMTVMTVMTYIIYVPPMKSYVPKCNDKNVCEYTYIYLTVRLELPIDLYIVNKKHGN